MDVDEETGHSRMLPRHGCNAYCRGSIHAEVVWCNITEHGPALARELLGRLCARWGVRCVSIEVAREAQRQGGTARQWNADAERWEEVPAIPDNDTPFLLVYDEGE